MKRYFAIGVAAALLVSAATISTRAAGDFESAKALYAAASYEEALTSLDQLEGNADPVQVNQYRALCLLALGRARDAEAPLQKIVAANPMYALPAAEVSPRLVDLFRDVRKRTLPTAARQLYSKAKSSYDAKDLADASAQFKTLLSVLADPDVSDRSADLADLKDLAEGFLALADAQLAAVKPPTPAPAAAAPAVVANTATAAAKPSEPRIYSPDDSGVRPPIELARSMPRWVPNGAMPRLTTFKGVLKLVIDEQGLVESASLLTPVYPTYNPELLKSTKNWRYQPATLNGVPVKYTTTLEIVLRPTGVYEE